MRAVESSLVKIRMTDRADKKAEVIATHLNRAIANLVFSDPSIRGWKSDSLSVSYLSELARITTPKIFEKVASYIKQYHDGDYLAAISDSIRPPIPI